LQLLTTKRVDMSCLGGVPFRYRLEIITKLTLKQLFMGPYLTAKQAAKYIGYSLQVFYKLVRDYQIPKYGPSRNRYRQLDLDNFMESPYCFIQCNHAHSQKTPDLLDLIDL